MATVVTKSIRSLKKGTKFYFYGDGDKKMIAIAAEKRGHNFRECKVEGKEGVFSFYSAAKVELVNTTS